MPKYSIRASQRTKSKESARGTKGASHRGNANANRRGGTKGLTADGSTRAWRNERDALPGKPRRCPDGRPPFVNHKRSRRLGGTDTPGNLEWKCGHNPGVGRPRASAPKARFSRNNKARQ